MKEVSLSPIRIMDAAQIKEKGILKGVTDDVASFIRRILEDPEKKYFAAMVSETDGHHIFGVLGLESISEQNRSATIVMYFAKELYFLGDEAYTEEDAFPYYQSALDHLLRYAFFQMDMHRLSLLISVIDSVSEKVAVSCHMYQVALLEEALVIGGAYSDAGLFCLLDSEYPDYSVGFVPFKKGVFAIRGDNESVESTHFYAYGDSIDRNLERNVAIRVGIADSRGVLKPEDSPEYKQLSELPFQDEVKKCMKEISEYIGKRRTGFTIHAYSPYGSSFQKKVWEKVSEIPYGVTRSYEDIALSLTGDDKVAARNLTRAVGAACRDNPLPVLIPCHRVIGKDGKLVGFSGGLEFKEYLLNHEMFGIHICEKE